MCVLVHVKDSNWMKMWGGKSEQILHCLCTHSFESAPAFRSLFSVVEADEKRTSAVSLDLCNGQLQKVFLVLLQPATALLAFCYVFCSTCSKVFCREVCWKQLVISPVACFEATIYWPGSKSGPVCCSIGFKTGNVLAVIQLACCHAPGKLWHSPTAVCSPGEHKWIPPRLCQFKKDEQRRLLRLSLLCVMMPQVNNAFRSRTIAGSSLQIVAFA